MFQLQLQKELLPVVEAHGARGERNAGGHNNSGNTSHNDFRLLKSDGYAKFKNLQQGCKWLRESAFWQGMRLIDELAAVRLFEAIAQQAHLDAAGGTGTTTAQRTEARAWLADWQECEPAAVKVAHRASRGTTLGTEGVEWHECRE